MSAPTHSPIPGPFRTEGNRVRAISHGQTFTVATCCTGTRFAPNAGPEFAAYLARAANSHAELVAVLEETIFKNTAAQTDKTVAVAMAYLLPKLRATLARAKGEA